MFRYIACLVAFSSVEFLVVSSLQVCLSMLQVLPRFFLFYQHPSTFNHLVQVIQLLCENGQISLFRDLKQHLTYSKKKYSKQSKKFHLSFTELTCFSCPEKTNISLRCTNAVFQHFHWHFFIYSEASLYLYEEEQFFAPTREEKFFDL